MADPLSLLKKQKDESKPAPKAATDKSPGLLDTTTLGASARSAQVPKSSLFDVESALGSSLPSGSGEMTVADRIQKAFSPSSNVDFPMVTEICDAVSKDPAALSEAVRLLCNGFMEPRSPVRRKLKALTILHELMYDQEAAAQLKRVPGARDSLWECQGISGSGLGASADEQIRMFATEIEKTCYGSAGDPFTPLTPADPFAPTFAPAARTVTASGSSDESFIRSSTSESSRGSTLKNYHMSSSEAEPQRYRKRDQVMDKLFDFGTLVKDNLGSTSEVAKKYYDKAKESLSGDKASRPENIPKLPTNPDAPRPALDISFDGLLPGEKVHLAIKQCYYMHSNPFCETPGRLLATSYRLKFQAQKGSLRDELSWLQEKLVLDIPMGLIEDLRLESEKSDAGVSQLRLCIVTKDGRKLIFLVSDPNDLAQVEELVASLSQPGEHFTSSLFAFRHAQALGGGNPQGWDLYDPVAEFSRLGVDTQASPSSISPWCLDGINREYGLCSTYPALLVRPRSISDVDLRNVASFRKRGRIPTMSWCGGPSLGYASLWRCAQPGEGIMGHASQADENLVRAIRHGKGGRGASLLFTLDLRSKKAAYANKLGGGGSEGYSDCRVVFGNIDNVHGVRDAWHKMRKAVSVLSSTEVGSWLKDVANSGWYDIIGAVLHCTCMVVEELDVRKANALIHCSDGWDRTAQVSALAQLCMDPYYRTVRGLCILIQKEFCSFGHRFRTRLGNGEKPTKAFEFTSALLLFIGKEALTNRYGTFLTDSEKERSQCAKRTLSFWPVVLSGGPAGGPLPEHLNPDYAVFDGVLRLSPTQVNYKVWEDYWFRYFRHPRDERRL